MHVSLSHNLCSHNTGSQRYILYMPAVITNSDYSLHIVLFFPPPLSPPPLLPLLLPQPQPSPYPPSSSFPVSGDAYIHADGRDIVPRYGLCWKFT